MNIWWTLHSLKFYHPKCNIFLKSTLKCSLTAASFTTEYWNKVNLCATSNNLRKWINGIIQTILWWCNALMMLQVLFFFDEIRFWVILLCMEDYLQQSLAVTFSSNTFSLSLSLSLSLFLSLDEGVAIKATLYIDTL